MIRLVNDFHPEAPGLDTAVSHALLRAVAAGRISETFRIHPTTRVLAFGGQDRSAPGYAAAVRAARDRGYLPLVRLAGGRAAVFHEGTLAFSWAIPGPEPRAAVTERFETISALLAGAFTDLGVDARVGEVPGEYCPGSYSVSIGGIAKVMGVGQRLVGGAAHVGGVIVVDGGRRIAEVLGPVYAALGLSWDPRTSGDLADVNEEISLNAVTDAVIARLSTHDTIEPSWLPGWLVDEGRQLVAEHVAPAA
ncbi:MAG TPA: lipoate--protein ligase family protein [Acidimicrobiia bacterium]|nr:lipoate--protein ligase family protein [Acidimicrobiia bacterium]